LHDQNPSQADEIGDISYNDIFFPNIEKAVKQYLLSEEVTRLGLLNQNLERNCYNFIGNVTLSSSPQPVDDMLEAMYVIQDNPGIVDDFYNSNLYLNVLKLVKHIPDIKPYKFI